MQYTPINLLKVTLSSDTTHDEIRPQVPSPKDISNKLDKLQNAKHAGSQETHTTRGYKNRKLVTNHHPKYFTDAFSCFLTLNC